MNDPRNDGVPPHVKISEAQSTLAALNTNPTIDSSKVTSLQSKLNRVTERWTREMASIKSKQDQITDRTNRINERIDRDCDAILRDAQNLLNG